MAVVSSNEVLISLVGLHLGVTWELFRIYDVVACRAVESDPHFDLLGTDGADLLRMIPAVAEDVYTVQKCLCIWSQVFE